jgi:hypothetical protein
MVQVVEIKNHLKNRVLQARNVELQMGTRKTDLPLNNLTKFVHQEDLINPLVVAHPDLGLAITDHLPEITEVFPNRVAVQDRQEASQVPARAVPVVARDQVKEEGKLCFILTKVLSIIWRVKQ